MKPLTARSYVAKLQRRSPLYRDDRAKQLLGVLAPRLPPEFHDMIAGGSLTVGELARFKPDIRTVTVAPREFAVLFNRGMMDFVYAVCRSLAGDTNVFGDAGLEAEAAVQLSDIAPAVAKVFRAWIKYNQWPWTWFPFGRKRISHATYRLNPDAWTMAENLATSAELFMLAHELGHVLIALTHSPTAEAEEEQTADAVGLLFMLPPDQRRMPFAGAVLAIRILAGLERAGFRFANVYPPARKRLELLLGVLRSTSPSEQYLDEMSTMAVAYSAQMDAAEDIIFGTASVSAIEEREGRITLIAILEELARGRLPRENFLKDFTATAEQLTPETLCRVLDALVGYYILEPTGLTYLPAQVRNRMRSSFIEMIPAFSPRLKSALEDIFAGWVTAVPS